MADQVSHESILAIKMMERLTANAPLSGAKLVEAIADTVRRSRSSDLSSFETLDLSFRALGRRGAEILGQCLLSGHLSNLKKLDLSWNYVEDAGVVVVAECFKSGNLRNLKNLNLAHNKVGDAGLVALLKSGNLRNLKNLNLGHNKVGHAGLVTLAECFKAGHLSNLEELVLISNNLGEAGVVSLTECFKALGHLRNLKILELASNKVGEAGLLALVESLKVNDFNNLEKLGLQNNEVGDTVLGVLAECFKGGHLRDLEKLDLCQNNVGDVGLLALVESLKGDHSSNLKELDLRSNNVGDAGLVALVESFKEDHLSTLEILDLEDNNVGDAGLVALVRYFHKSSSNSAGHSSSLQEVSLHRDFMFGDEAILELVRALEAGDLQFLTKLQLARVSQVAERSIVSAYRDNSTLVLDLSLNNCSSTTHDSLRRLRDRNQTWIKTGKVLEREPHVSGTNGKVFLCGNAEVGKICKSRPLICPGRAFFAFSPPRNFIFCAALPFRQSWFTEFSALIGNVDHDMPIGYRIVAFVHG